MTHLQRRLLDGDLTVDASTIIRTNCPQLVLVEREELSACQNAQAAHGPGGTPTFYFLRHKMLERDGSGPGSDLHWAEAFGLQPGSDLLRCGVVGDAERWSSAASSRDLKLLVGAPTQRQSLDKLVLDLVHGGHPACGRGQHVCPAAWSRVVWLYSRSVGSCWLRPLVEMPPSSPDAWLLS